jgi:hypothetical protein
MSVLETPRIYFRGQIAWDPIVTNNYTNLYDETSSDTYLPCGPDRAAAFRTQAINQVPCGNWNPHGTHRSTFFESSVSGADIGAGVVQDDPFVKSPASFMGMLVDLEPYGAYTSQLFFDKMTFGIDGGYRIAAKRSSRLTARYINFGRNAVGAIAGIASAVWQTCFTKENLRIDSFDSPALQALQRALETDGDILGLTVQFNTYRTIYYDTPVPRSAALQPKALELVKKLQAGGFQPNPARSMMVGTIGLWRKGEPVHEPCDRTLIPGPGNPQAPALASAHARLTGDSLTLDLSNSISETGLDLKKFNYGELSVVAVDPAVKVEATLATFDYAQYDRSAYEETSGIVVLKVDPSVAAKAASADLQLLDAAGNVLLAESALRAIPVVPNQYMDQGGPALTAQIQVYDRGVPAGAGVPVAVYSMSADGGSITCQFQGNTAADGTVSFPLSGDTAGIVAYVPVAGDDPQAPSQGIDPQVNTYLYVRTLTADGRIASLPPTWANVYGNVLVNWHAMAPCMDNWLNLGNETQVRAYAKMIKNLTDPAAFENFMYMPVVRDLTPGARTLLYRFLDSAQPESVALEAAPAAMKALPEEKPSLAELSRKLRQ